MKSFYLSSERLGERLITVDDGDWELIKDIKWTLMNSSKQPDNVYAQSKGLKPQITMHRFIMGLKDTSIFIDHIDRNGLNNQRSNMRLCTPSQNQFNKGPHKRNKTGFKGVSFQAQSGKYTAQIACFRKTIYGGVYSTAEAAAAKYNELAKKYHGEFAYQNII